MKFSPLKFQGSLAAAGVSLMPFNYMKSTVFKGIPFHLNHFKTLDLTSFEYFSSILLIAIMLVFIILHLTMTTMFLKELIVWLIKGKEFYQILDNPKANTSLFSPLISLPMSLIVIMGPLSFFIPNISQNISTLIPVAMAIFTLLWFTVIMLEVTVVRKLQSSKIPLSDFNFAWLLDVLAFGAVSLLGSSLTGSTSGNLASIVALMTSITLVIGIILSFTKVTILFYHYLKVKREVPVNLKPAFYLIIPPLCLLWFSAYKILGFISKMFSVDTSVLSFLIIIGSYASAVICFVFLAFMLFDYFKSQFLRSEFSPAQWGII
ncbi:hypothetical protein EZV73_07475 [Acidaminobacter sp. JC074]|uniref:selenoprotein TsoY n=1 Tax=Acidaminobacter sp. JC074 TaxID=2530199 RepID=UPI001F0CE4F3|nr:hypothetical protein [Acidaminobacter sp. JC074]MCH4887405.1 hypothetical protein [Acidaminobacter sp. JC074]